MGKNQLPLLVVAGVVRRHASGLVLIVQRPEDKEHGGLWEFPGGKIDPGESPEDALQRELQEELAIDVEVGDVVVNVFRERPQRDLLLLTYRATLTDGEPQCIEVADFAWVSPPDLHTFPLCPADETIASHVVLNIKPK